MTPTESVESAWRKYMEQRHADLRADYCGSDGNSGFKKDVQTALWDLQQQKREEKGFRDGVKATLSTQNKLFLAVIALLGLAVSLLVYYGSRDHQHQGLFSFTHTDTVVAFDSAIRDNAK